MPRIGSKTFNVEFNDSVFETKAWQSSRYDGKELSGAQINRHTIGDVSFGKTPVIRNVSRNIYVGNAIIPLGGAEASGDETLVQFPSSSYITIEKYFTVNDDDTISENNFDGSDLDSKNGFYRSFYEDFPIGGDIQLKLLDESVDNFTLDNYKIAFNQGKLHRLIRTRGGINIGSLNTANQQNTSLFKYYDDTILVPSGELVSVDVYNNSFRTTNFPTPNSIVVLSDLNTFFNNIGGYLSSSVENRIFTTFVSGNDSFTSPIITGSLPPANIGTFSTAELQQKPNTSYGLGSTIYKVADKSKFNVGYGPSAGLGYIVSLLNDSTPSILTNLFQPNHLPGSTGNLPFVVIPSNLHPYIKDNLLYFLGQAGIDIGNRRIPSQLDGQNRKLT